MSSRQLKLQRKKLEDAALALETALLVAIHVEPLGEPIWLGAAQISKARELALEALQSQIALIDTELSSPVRKKAAA